MNIQKEIKLFRSDAECNELKKIAENNVKRDVRFLLYRIICAVISLLFMSFAVYAVVFFIGTGEPFQIGMLIYIAVPLIGARLPFGFVKLRHRELVAEICEESETLISFFDSGLTVSGRKKAKLVRKRDGSASFEKNGSLFSEGDGSLIAFSYDIFQNELRYFAYDEEMSRFRFVLGSSAYPDLYLPKNSAFAELCNELENRGIKKTAYVK